MFIRFDSGVIRGIVIVVCFDLEVIKKLKMFWNNSMS